MTWREPEPPTNVRIETPDGRIVPLTVLYTGRTRGITVWEAVVPDDVPGGCYGVLRMDKLPAKTQITLTWTWSEPCEP
jgi:hypothetical protein